MLQFVSRARGEAYPLVPVFVVGGSPNEGVEGAREQAYRREAGREPRELARTWARALAVVCSADKMEAMPSASLLALAAGIQKVQARVSHPKPMNSPRCAGGVCFSLKVNPRSARS
jgi:hypothetical protein